MKVKDKLIAKYASVLMGATRNEDTIRLILADMLREMWVMAGQKTSERKATSARANGQRGGRPRKEETK